MPDFNKLSDDVYTCGQISRADADSITDFGIQSIIINRPDGEAQGQPPAQDMISWAEGKGLKAVYIPMTPGQLSPELIDSFADALASLPKPILAHCASGTRSTILWCFANVKTLGVDAVMNTATEAGYNVEGVRGALTRYAT